MFRAFETRVGVRDKGLGLMVERHPAPKKQSKDSGQLQRAIAGVHLQHHCYHWAEASLSEEDVTLSKTLNIVLA